MIGSLCFFVSCGGGSIDPDKKPGTENPGDNPGTDGPYVDGSKTIEGHEAVDLGTGILWATTNVGAATPTDYGRYFSWGEVAPKTTYNWKNYAWSDDYEPETPQDYENLRLTKYSVFKLFGVKDDKKVLDIEDDAAAQNWKGSWRMPTKEEVDALLKNCTWEWVRKDGLYGYEIKSEKTGKSIYIPAAGMVAKDGVHNSAMSCNCWTSSLYTQNEQYYAYSFVHLDAGKTGSEHVSWSFRYLGMTIRPVSNKD